MNMKLIWNADDEVNMMKCRWWNAQVKCTWDIGNKDRMEMKFK